MKKSYQWRPAAFGALLGVTLGWLGITVVMWQFWIALIVISICHNLWFEAKE